MVRDIEDKIMDLLPDYRKMILPFAPSMDIYRFANKDCPILINDFDEKRLNKAKYDVDKQFKVWFKSEKSIYKILKKYDYKCNMYVIELPVAYPSGDVEALLDAIGDISCKVMLIGMESVMYQDYLAEWHNETGFEINGQQRQLWFNFSGSEQLELI